MESAQICRLCAREACLLLPIFEGEGLEQQLSVKIHKYLPIQVAQNDCLPVHVCGSCSTTLNAWHNLVEECIASDKKLRDLVAIQQKHSAILANEESSFEDAAVCDESEDETARSQAVREDSEGSTGATCKSARWDQASSLLSKFRIRRFLDPKTFLHEQHQAKISNFNFFPQDKVPGNVDCQVNNVSDKEYSHNNNAVYVTKFPTCVELNGQVFTVSGINDADDPFTKTDDNCEAFSVSESKDTKQFQNHSLLESQNLKCDLCQTIFTSQLKLTAHRTVSHSFLSQCKYCDEFNGDAEDLEAHELLHKKDALCCPVCREPVSSFRSLRRHFDVHADTGIRLCNFCNRVCIDKSELEQHEATHKNVRPYKCDTCGKAFRYKANLLNHCSTHLDDNIVRKFKCDFCGTVYRSKNILKRHLALHSNEDNKNYECETCGKSFIMIQSLKIHVKVHSNSRPYKCALCEMAFKWKKNLRTHQRVHRTLAEKHYGNEHKRKITRVQCEICGKYLASKWNLSVHVKRHDINFTGSSMCHICGKTLCDSQAMSRHLKVHAGIKPFKCTLCGKNFGTKMSRDDHERIHTGEKPFCCDVCGKCFSSKPHLHVHRVIHSDNRPFKCTFCPKSFRRRPHLVLHIRTHTGEKPYTCEMCSRAFIQKNDMMKHMLTHSNVRPFVCDCGISFRQKRDLNKHKRKHTDVEIPFPTATPRM